MSKVIKVRKSESYNWLYLAKVGDTKTFKKSYKAVYYKLKRWDESSEFQIMPGSIDNSVIVKRIS